MGSNEILRPLGEEPMPITLAQWRAEIINAVLCDGLQPSATLRENGGDYLGSDNKHPLDLVYGRYIVPSIARKSNKPGLEHYYIPRNFMRAALYATPDSILPAISERPQEMLLVSSNKDKAGKAFMERALSSFLIICEDKSKHPVKKTLLKGEIVYSHHHFHILSFQ